MKRIILTLAALCFMAAPCHGDVVAGLVVKSRVVVTHFYFECPDCKKALKFKNSDRGKFGRCSKCKSITKLPALRRVVRKICKGSL